MARGAGQQMAQQGFNQTNQMNQQMLGQQQQIGNYLLPQYQNMVQNPGYDQATKNAITLNSQGAAAASYGGASDALARSAARTGNSAGMVAGQDQLAQQKANTMSNVAAQNQVTFANDAQKQQEQGLQGISSLYGMDTNLLAKTLGLGPEYLQAFNQAKPGFWQQFGDQLAGGAIGGGLTTLAQNV